MTGRARTLKRLGRMMGLGLTSMRNHTRSLEQKGYLVPVRREGRSNAYDLTPLFTALEETMSRVEREKGIAPAETLSTM